MSKLPVISGREIVRVLTRIGFAIVGRKGSHVRLKRRRDEEVLILTLSATEVRRFMLPL